MVDISKAISCLSCFWLSNPFSIYLVHESKCRKDVFFMLCKISLEKTIQHKILNRWSDYLKIMVRFLLHKYRSNSARIWIFSSKEQTQVLMGSRTNMHCTKMSPNRHYKKGSGIFLFSFLSPSRYCRKQTGVKVQAGQPITQKLIWLWWDWFTSLYVGAMLGTIS